MYREIFELKKFCIELGIKIKFIDWFDGYAIVFPGCADIIQCCLNRKCKKGFVEVYMECPFDYKAISLEQAKVLIINYYSRLVTPNAVKNISARKRANYIKYFEN